jgi:opacity protein-like surface antigen
MAEYRQIIGRGTLHQSGMTSSPRFGLMLAHDVFRKPVRTFRHHAQARDEKSGATASTTNAGWTAGGGLEMALGKNWTAKVEYLRVDLGSLNCGTVCTGSPSNVDFTTSLVRGGVNFKF